MYKVWVVTGHVQWEGSEILSVCGTKEIAEQVAAVKRMAERTMKFDEITTTEYEVTQ